MNASVYVFNIEYNKCIKIDIHQIMNDISCISIIIVNTDPDCYQLVSLSGIINSTTTMKYHKTSTTDESHSRQDQNYPYKSEYRKLFLLVLMNLFKYKYSIVFFFNSRIFSIIFCFYFREVPIIVGIITGVSFALFSCVCITCVIRKTKASLLEEPRNNNVNEMIL